MIPTLRVDFEVYSLEVLEQTGFFVAHYFVKMRVFCRVLSERAAKKVFIDALEWVTPAMRIFQFSGSRSTAFRSNAFMVERSSFVSPTVGLWWIFFVVLRSAFQSFQVFHGEFLFPFTLRVAVPGFVLLLRRFSWAHVAHWWRSSGLKIRVQTIELDFWLVVVGLACRIDFQVELSL